MNAPISSNSGIVIRQLTPDWRAAWDAYVHQHPDGTFFHLSGWQQVIEDSFGHECAFLIAERDGEIKGLLPLCVTRSRLFGKSLISLPFCMQGGPLTSDADAFAALAKASEDMCHQERLGLIEYRSRYPLALGPGWQTP